MGIIEPQTRRSEDHCAIHYTTRAKSFIFCDHCALNEKGELACKGEPAEVASSAKQTISILATRAKCKTYLNYMLFKANFQVKLCNYVAINTNFLECCFLLL